MKTFEVMLIISLVLIGIGASMMIYSFFEYMNDENPLMKSDLEKHYEPFFSSSLIPLYLKLTIIGSVIIGIGIFGIFLAKIKQLKGESIPPLK